MTPHPNALEIADLVMHFGPVRAVDGVSLTIPRGRVTALVGESGSGKSTVGRCVVRLVEPTAGTVRIAGTDVTHLSRRRLRPHRGAVSIVFQDPAALAGPADAGGRDRGRAAAAAPASGSPGATGTPASPPCSTGSACAPRWPGAIPTSCPAGSGSGSASPGP